MQVNRIGRLVLLTAVVLTVGVPLCTFAGPEETYRDDIKPILRKHCYECHGAEKQKGDLNFENFSDYTSVTEASEVWYNALQRVQAYEMPPKSKGKELGFDEFQRLVRWMRRLPQPEQVDCNQIASDRTANFYRGYVMSRRLNRSEYANTIRDLFGVEFDLHDALPADGGGGEGFDTTGDALFISSIHIEKYLAAADKVLNAVLLEDTKKTTAELKAARTRILAAKPGSRVEPREAAKKNVAAFARRAWRRPVTDDEVERLLTMFDRASQRGDSFVASLRLALKGALVSPHFLFLAEPEPGDYGVQRLGAVPLASKLSYFLWSSMPDEELLTLAENGRLADTNVYRQQIRRMLSDPKAEALGERFALQWLDLERLGTEVRPDPKTFPEFDDELGRMMLREVTAVFNHVMRSDRSLLELIDSDYSFINARLAKLYEIDGVSTSDLQKVSFRDRNRGGVLGMAAVHAASSYPLRTSPVLRGRWILESLLGDKVPPPPPDVPALEENAAAEKSLSFREQLEQHRQKADCAGCHNKMDPLGFGLENFDVLGRWRDADRGQPIDADGELPSGQKFTGPVGLKTVLMQRKNDVMKHLTRKMTGFAFGRELNRFDQCVVDNAMRTLQENDYRAWVLIEQIATSFQFQHRFYPKPE